MLSKTLYFNRTLFRKNLTRFWPLWGMASFGGALFPLALLLEILRDSAFSLEALELTAAYYEVLTYGVPIISLCYAILCAMTVWSYLYNARSVGLMHTLPIRREGLFLTNFLSGMAMMLIPYVVTGGFMILLSVGCAAFDPVGVLVTILGVLADSFFYFSTATLVAFCVGNVFALPAVYFLLHFLSVMLEWLVSVFSQGFIFGLSGNYAGVLEFLSPTVYLMSQVGVKREYERVYEQGALTGTGYYESVLQSVKLENAWIIAVYALVGAACLTLAYALYRRRRSESAGDVIAVGWMKPVFRYGGAALAALLGGLGLYELFWRSYNYGDYYDAIPMVVCMVVAGAIGYFGASMLLAKSLKIFRKTWKGMGLVVLGCTVICCVLHFDLLNVTGWVPEAGKTESVTLYVEGNNYTFYPDEDGELLEQVRQIHQAIAADAQYFKGRENSSFSVTEETRIASTYVRLHYYLKNGQTVTRRYSLLLNEDRMRQEGTAEYLLDQLVNSREMKLKRLHLGDNRYTPNGGSLYLEASGNGFDLSSREATAILEAVGKDADAGTWGNVDWFDEREDRDRYAVDLSLTYGWIDPEDDGIHTDYVSISLWPEMKHTVRCLKELNLVDDAGLKTYLEAYPETYDQDYRKYVETYGYEIPYREYAEITGASVGIIGGADGPTAVYVRN